MPNNKEKKVSGKEYVSAPFPYLVSDNYKNWSTNVVIDQKLKPINPLQCGMQTCPPRYSFTSDDRDFWLLHFVISGKGALVNHNGRQSVLENEIFVTRPFENVTYTADKFTPWKYIWIGFTADTQIPRILETNDVIYAPYLKDFFISAYDTKHFENVDTYGAYEHYLCGIIWQIFGLLIKNSHKNATVSDNYIKPAITIMTLYYFDVKLTVAEIASRLHISKEHFGRIFKSETGSSPKKYLNDIRMQKAVEFLKHKSDTVTQISKKVGFPDVFAFSRAFSRHFGCSPSEYAKKHRQENHKAIIEPPM